jgi:hypothetical protein
MHVTKIRFRISTATLLLHATPFLEPEKNRSSSGFSDCQVHVVTWGQAIGFDPRRHEWRRGTSPKNAADGRLSSLGSPALKVQPGFQLGLVF